MAARLISLGVIELEEAKELLRMGFTLAKQAATNGREREFAACMKIALEVAKLEQAERHKILDKAMPDKHSHTIEQTPPVTLEQLHSDENYVRYLEQQTGTDSHAGGLCNGHQQRNGNGMANGQAPGHPESEPD